MSQERLTEDLVKRLLEAETPEAYLAEDDAVIDRDLVSYLHELLAVRHLKRADVIRDSGVNGTFVYDIFKGKSMPGRDNALMLAFGLHCDEELFRLGERTLFDPEDEGE